MLLFLVMAFILVVVVLLVLLLVVVVVMVVVVLVFVSYHCRWCLWCCRPFIPPSLPPPPSFLPSLYNSLSLSAHTYFSRHCL